MMTRVDSPLLRKLSAFTMLSADDRAQLGALFGVRRFIKAGTSLGYENQDDHRAYVLQEGWACTCKHLADGQCQVVNFQVPGDFLGLRGLLLRRCDQNYTALTDAIVYPVEKRNLVDVFSRSPKLGLAILWAASREEAMIAEHLANIGRRNAIARTAHFMLELSDRLRLVGMGTDTGFACPLTQTKMADALGLSAIHLNRVLRKLREKGLLAVRNGGIAILNRQGLIELADYDPAYMDTCDAVPMLPVQQEFALKNTALS
jgi:CRP-like cAMP-binding protein